VLRLGFLGLLGWGIFHLIEIFGWNLVPVLLSVYLVFKRIATLTWLTSKYFKDSTSTLERIYNPEGFKWNKVPLTDRLSLVILVLVPDLKDYTDFKSYPYPHGIWERERPLSYIKKTAFWMLASLSFLTYWYLNGIQDIWEYLLLSWSLLVFVGAIVARKSKTNQKLRVFYEKRFIVIWMSLAELVEKASFGLVNRSYFFSKRRVKLCILIGFVGIIISVGKILLNSLSF
jgi:hypothetical protein